MNKATNACYVGILVMALVALASSGYGNEIKVRGIIQDGIIISAGSAEGIRTGQKGTVFTITQSSGRNYKERVAKFIVTKVEDVQSEARITDHTGEIKIGFLVEFDKPLEPIKPFVKPPGALDWGQSISGLIGQQGLATRVMDELSRRLPEWVWLTEAIYDAKGISIKGRALSNMLIADYISGLEASPQIINVNLIASTQKTTQGDQYMDFALRAGVERKADGENPGPAALNNIATDTAPKVDRVEDIFYMRQETANILRQIQALAYDSRLDVLRFAPDKEIKRDFYAECPISIQVSGNYQHLGTFLSKVNQSAKLITVHDLSIVARDKQTKLSTIVAGFIIKAYILNDSIDPSAASNADLIAAEARLRTDKLRYERMDKLFKAQLISKDELETAKAQYHISSAQTNAIRLQQTLGNSNKKLTSAQIGFYRILKSNRYFESGVVSSRDPFKDLLAGRSPEAIEANIGSQFLIDDVVLFGIVKNIIENKNTYIAMIGLPESFPAFAKVGDKIADGYILSISETQVVFRKTHEQGVPLIKPIDVIKEIHE